MVYLEVYFVISNQLSHLTRARAFTFVPLAEGLDHQNLSLTSSQFFPDRQMLWIQNGLRGEGVLTSPGRATRISDSGCVLHCPTKSEGAPVTRRYV